MGKSDKGSSEAKKDGPKASPRATARLTVLRGLSHQRHLLRKVGGVMVQWKRLKKLAMEVALQL